ncbi:MAG TPA: kelch repeat-containing protein [Polyangiaceae bacterium]|nr:kelch repeat-containing protein [Polyangiaceae bacterium]
MGLGARVVFAFVAVAVVSCVDAEPTRDGPSGAALPGSAALAPTFSAGLLDAELPSRASGVLKLTNTKLHASAEVALAGAADRPLEPIGDATRYRDALGPGADLRLRTTPAGVEDLVTLPAAPPSGEVRYHVALGDGVAGLRVAGGVVELVDAHGTPALRASRTAVVDARGARHELALDDVGCAVDRDVRPPWGRPVTPPGASRCDVVVRLPGDLAYPAELDPLWSPAGDMVIPRYDFRTALLDDGRILLAGGSGFGDRKEVELFDPATETWSLLGSTAWLPYTAVQFVMGTLGDGRVILAGGLWGITGSQVVKSTLVFSTTTMTWTAKPDMAIERMYHTGTVLSDGRYLVTGGYDYSETTASCEIFDPSSDTWVPAPDLPVPLDSHAALEIGGRVLVTGGENDFVISESDGYLFDPAGGGAWTGPFPMVQGRNSHAMARLGADSVLVVGGWISPVGGFAHPVEVFDIPTKTFKSTGETTFTAYETRAVSGPLGGALMLGGCGDQEDFTYCDAASKEVLWFDPVDGKKHPAGDIGVPRGKHDVQVLGDGRIVAMGGQSGDAFLSDTRVFLALPPAEACTQNFECASGFCVDGVCCDEACDGTCEGCKASQTGGADGTCAPVLDGTDPRGDCVDSGAPTCAGNGLCKAGACDAYAAPGCGAGKCSSAADCASGFCVDGVCCDTDCALACTACSAAKKGEGLDGVCGFVATGTDPDADCADVGTSTCADLRVCNGTGVCSPADVACAPGLCGAEGCIPSCVDDTGCASDGACVANQCVSKATLCTDGTKALGRDGVVVDCAPFTCTPDGTCLTACSSVDDCADGQVCDGETRECVAPPAESGGDAGCACEAGAPGHRGAGVFFVGALVALAAGRRRRSRR